ncbi:MAG TPA: GreA/GreB family elongation factor [Polyangiaceae bacterium]|nr:GreA/GreB family elongation factor [Polyangiaceae bacterium]
MSRAFVKEDSQTEAPVMAHRAPLPPGVPNYVTPRGLAHLREELVDLLAELQTAEPVELPEAHRARSLALMTRKLELEERLASAVLVERTPENQGEVRFGANVTVRIDAHSSSAAKTRVYQLVGADEADPQQGRIAFFTPIARALIGRSVGDEVQIQTPRGEETLAIISVNYDSSPSSSR